jgi:hypothetical protein
MRSNLEETQQKRRLGGRRHLLGRGFVDRLHANGNWVGCYSGFGEVFILALHKAKDSDRISYFQMDTPCVLAPLKCFIVLVAHKSLDNRKYSACYGAPLSLMRSCNTVFTLVPREGNIHQDHRRNTILNGDLFKLPIFFLISRAKGTLALGILYAAQFDKMHKKRSNG